MAVLPWQIVRVAGPSMVPTLYDGDVIVVRHGAPIRPGDVVLARFRSLPDRFVVKRVERSDGDGWALRSDNDATVATAAATAWPRSWPGWCCACRVVAVGCRVGCVDARDGSRLPVRWPTVPNSIHRVNPGYL